MQPRARASFLLIPLILLVLALLGGQSGRVTTMPIEYEIAAGYLTGYGKVNKFGRNQDADQTEDSIWEGSDVGGPVRCFDVINTTAVALYISSDHQDDASLDVTIEYLDSSWRAQIITQALGTAVGGTATAFIQIGAGTIMRINRAFAASTSLTGNVYIHIDDTDGNDDGIPDTILTDLVAVVIAGENQTLQGCYTVPLGFTALLTQFCTTNINTPANAVVTFRLRASIEGAASRVQETLELNEATYQCTPHSPPLTFVEKTDIELTSISSANDSSTTGTFDVLLVPK